MAEQNTITIRLDECEGEQMKQAQGTVLYCTWRKLRVCAGSRKGDVLHEITSVRSSSVDVSNEMSCNSASCNQSINSISNLATTFCSMVCYQRTMCWYSASNVASS